MPTYDYKCLKCDKTYEFFHKMTEDPFYKCPECGSNLKKMIGSGSAPIFKGTGFYQTDYKNKSDRSSKPAPKGESNLISDVKKEPKKKK